MLVYCVCAYFSVPLQRNFGKILVEGMIRSYYSVAEHLFAVECSDSALLACMTNYLPFREPTPNPSLKGRELGKEIFTLRVEMEEAKGERQIGEEWTHVLTDNAEAAMPRIEV